PPSLSTPREAHAELGGSPCPRLPGETTRLQGCGPGQPPPPAAPEVELTADLTAELADEDRQTRVSAWASVRPRLAAAVELDPQDESWQLVQSRAEWTGTDSRPVDTLAVYLRAGEQYFLPVQEGD